MFRGGRISKNLPQISEAVHVHTRKLFVDLRINLDNKLRYRAGFTPLRSGCAPAPNILSPQ